MGMIFGGPTCMRNSRRLVKIYRKDVVSSKMVKLVDWTHLVMYYTQFQSYFINKMWRMWYTHMTIFQWSLLKLQWVQWFEPWSTYWVDIIFNEALVLLKVTPNETPLIGFVGEVVIPKWIVVISKIPSQHGSYSKFSNGG